MSTDKNATPPVVRNDGYDEITLGDPDDPTMNAMLARIDGETFWRLHLPDHDDSAESSAEIQNQHALLAARASLLLLELNGATLKGGAE